MQTNKILTVADAIKLLQQFDQNLPMYFYETEINEYFPCTDKIAIPVKLCEASEGDGYTSIQDADECHATNEEFPDIKLKIKNEFDAILLMY